MQDLKRKAIYQNQQSAEGGAGGGGAAPATITPEVQALIDSHIAGLKTKNGELIAAQKQLKEQLGTFDGIDPVEARNILKRFSEDEEGKLIREGKIEDVFKKRTERMKVDYEKQIKEREEKVTRAEAKAKKLEAKTLAGAIRDAAIKAGALPEALDDIVLRGASLWVLDDNGDIVAQQGGMVLKGKDGNTPLTPSEWTATMRDTAPHLWPRAQGAGAQGAGAGQKTGGKTMTRAEHDERASKGESMGAFFTSGGRLVDK